MKSLSKILKEEISNQEKRLINILKEISNSIGYWIDKFGKIYNVDDSSVSHYRYAQQNFKDVQKELKRHYIPDKAPGQAIINVALKLGYIRIIRDRHADKIDYYIQLEKETLKNISKNTLLNLLSKDQNRIGTITFDDRRIARTFFDIEEFEDNLNTQSILREEDWKRKFIPKERKLIDLSLTTKQPSIEVEKIILKYQDPYLAYDYLMIINKKPYNLESIKKILKRSSRHYGHFELYPPFYLKN